MIIKYEAPPCDADAHDPSNRLFGLPATKNDVVAYHQALGYKVEHLELSSELVSRFLPNLAVSHTPLFAEDGLLKLAVPMQGNEPPPTSDHDAGTE